MFKHILIPTDGSPVSAKAVRAGVALAKENGARVTAYHCKDPLPRAVYSDGYIPNKAIIAELERRADAVANKHVAAVARVARKAGVACEPLVDRAALPSDGIVEAAARRKCDLVVIGTHGYRGLTRLALGSVAEKVARLSKVPVLVYR